jgi:hypothetical protein
MASHITLEAAWILALKPISLPYFGTGARKNSGYVSICHAAREASKSISNRTSKSLGLASLGLARLQRAVAASSGLFTPLPPLFMTWV